jgi:hypothetical protein
MANGNLVFHGGENTVRFLIAYEDGTAVLSPPSCFYKTDEGKIYPSAKNPDGTDSLAYVRIEFSGESDPSLYSVLLFDTGGGFNYDEAHGQSQYNGQLFDSEASAYIPVDGFTDVRQIRIDPQQTLTPFEIKYIEFFNRGRSIVYGPDAILDQFELLNAAVSISENGFLHVVPDNMEELHGGQPGVSGVAFVGKDGVTKDYNDIFGG